MTPHDFATLFAGTALGVFLVSPLAAWRIAASLRKTTTMAVSQAAQDAIAKIASLTQAAASVPGLEQQIAELKQNASDTDAALEAAVNPPPAA